MEYQKFCALPIRAYPLHGVPLFGLPGVVPSPAVATPTTGGSSRGGIARYISRFPVDDDQDLVDFIKAIVCSEFLN